MSFTGRIGKEFKGWVGLGIGGIGFGVGLGCWVLGSAQMCKIICCYWWTPAHSNNK